MLGEPSLLSLPRLIHYRTKRNKCDARFGQTVVASPVASTMSEQNGVVGKIDRGVAVPAVRIVEQRDRILPTRLLITTSGYREWSAFSDH